jgi:hypothetical protein
MRTFPISRTGTSRSSDSFGKEQLGVGSVCLEKVVVAVVGMEEGAFDAESRRCHSKEIVRCLTRNLSVRTA